jgi:hypothetical protein
MSIVKMSNVQSTKVKLNAGISIQHRATPTALPHRTAPYPTS